MVTIEKIIKVTNVNWFSLLLAGTLAVVILGLGALIGIGFAQAAVAFDWEVISTIGTLCLTTALVLITAYYAFQTRRTVSEMQESRYFSFLPILAIEASSLSGDILNITLLNVGSGLARKITLMAPFVNIALPDTGAGVRHSTSLKLDVQKIMASKSPELTILYVDIFNRIVKSTASIIIIKPEKGSLKIGEWRYHLPS